MKLMRNLKNSTVDNLDDDGKMVGVLICDLSL